MNIKKIIAREAIILIALALIGFIASYSVYRYLVWTEEGSGWTWYFTFDVAFTYIAISIGAGYIIRFIIWAVRKLRKK